MKCRVNNSLSLHHNTICGGSDKVPCTMGTQKASKISNQKLFIFQLGSLYLHGINEPLVSLIYS